MRDGQTDTDRQTQTDRWYHSLTIRETRQLYTVHGERVAWHRKQTEKRRTKQTHKKGGRKISAWYQWQVGPECSPFCPLSQ